jgi:uncharacterized protein with von Willebrand factor type A (vWA) domain
VRLRIKASVLVGLLALVGGFVAGRAYTGKKLLPIVAAPQGNSRELYQLAGDQIAAFRRNDFPTAYGFAASGIRQKFPLDQFSEMVRQTYPHLTRSGRLNFGQTQFAADLRASAMIYVSSGGESVPMIYAFVKEQGQWKIEGVQMLRMGSERFAAGEPRT